MDVAAAAAPVNRVEQEDQQGLTAWGQLLMQLPRLTRLTTFLKTLVHGSLGHHTPKQQHSWQECSKGQ
jgi:hypothetical protein